MLYRVLLGDYQLPRRLLLTGTPVQNDIGELWALLHFCLPRVFHDRDVFLAAFAQTGVLPAVNTQKQAGEEGLSS